MKESGDYSPLMQQIAKFKPEKVGEWVMQGNEMEQQGRMKKLSAFSDFLKRTLPMTINNMNAIGPLKESVTRIFGPDFAVGIPDPSQVKSAEEWNLIVKYSLDAAGMTDIELQRIKQIQERDKSRARLKEVETGVAGDVTVAGIKQKTTELQQTGATERERMVQRRPKAYVNDQGRTIVLPGNISPPKGYRLAKPEVTPEPTDLSIGGKTTPTTPKGAVPIRTKEEYVELFGTDDDWEGPGYYEAQ